MPREAYFDLFILIASGIEIKYVICAQIQGIYIDSKKLVYVSIENMQSHLKIPNNWYPAMKFALYEWFVCYQERANMSGEFIK